MKVIRQIMKMTLSIAWVSTGMIWGVEQQVESRETLNLLQKKLVEISNQTYNTHPDKNRVLVLGPTGSGKSTLVTYLAGVPLKVGQKPSGQKILIAQGTLPGIEIGDGALAQTKVPAAWVDTINDVVYWDCPGFLDTEGPEQEISNAAMIHKIVYNEERRTSDPVKILFVVPYDYVADEEGTYFWNQLTRVTGMFPDEQLGRSLYLIVTQVKPGNSVQSRLLQLLDNLQRPENNMKERDLSIVRSLRTRVTNNLFYTFPKPDLGSSIGSDYATDRDAIDRVLYAEHISLRVILKLSQEASEYIGGLCGACQSHLIGQFKKEGPQIIKDQFVKKMQREEYDEVREQIERLKALSQNIKNIDSFEMTKQLEEFIGHRTREEIEKTLRTLESLKNLEGFQGVDVRSLMRNLLKTVFPEVLRTVEREVIGDIGRYIASQGIDEIRSLDPGELLSWYTELEGLGEVDVALERFKRMVPATEELSRYTGMVNYLRSAESTLSFRDPETIMKIRNAHAPYVVSILQKELERSRTAEKGQEERIKQMTAAHQQEGQQRISELEVELERKTTEASEAREEIEAIAKEKGQLEVQIGQLTDDVQEKQQQISELENRIRESTKASGEKKEAGPAAARGQVIERPRKGPALPEIALGHEAIYERFMTGRLLYEGREIGRISDMCNPNTLEGTFNLSGCGDAGRYLSINTGYRKGKKAENANKLEIWFVPKFLVERDLATTASHFQPIMGKWTAPIGIFWTWGEWDNLGWFDYLVAQGLDEISAKNLYKNWTNRSEQIVRRYYKPQWAPPTLQSHKQFHVHFVN